MLIDALVHISGITATWGRQAAPSLTLPPSWEDNHLFLFSPGFFWLCFLSQEKEDGTHRQAHSLLRQRVSRLSAPEVATWLQRLCMWSC